MPRATPGLQGNLTKATHFVNSALALDREFLPALRTSVYLQIRAGEGKLAAAVGVAFVFDFTAGNVKNALFLLKRRRPLPSAPMK